MSARTTRARSGRHLAAATVIGVAVLLATAPGASAHVSVAPDTAEPGGYAKEAFRVPNERDDTSTVRIEVAFPADHPFGHVSVQPVPGWKATVRKQRLDEPVRNGDHEITEAVSSIVWQGGTIRPGEFQEFPVSLGPLPENTGELVFKTLQTYSDGEVVRWIDVRQEGGPEPEHPAPVLRLKPGTADPAAPVGAASTPEPVAATTTGTGSSADPVSRWLGGAALAVALGALGRAVLRRPAEGVRTTRQESQQEKATA